jgi:Fe-S cluster assembly protein SufB
MTDNYQESDSGTNMIHNGQNTRSKVLSKSVALGHSKGTFRSKIKVSSEAINTISHSKCDSLILNNDARSISIPMIDVSNTKSDISHEASTATINEDLLTYCQQRGLSNDQAISLIVSGECYDIFKQLPLNYIVELKKIIPTYFNN